LVDLFESLIYLIITQSFTNCFSTFNKISQYGHRSWSSD